VRPTTTGLVASDGSSTNDNRAMTMRGYRYTVEGNDYEVHSNMAHAKGIKINDGEGIMHEAYCNTAIKDSRLLNNTGNRYLCLWCVHVDGLLIQGNKVTATGAAIHVLGGGRTVRNLRIVGNELTAGRINVSARVAENIEIRGNRYAGPGVGRIEVGDLAWASYNENFEALVPPPKKK